MNCNQVTYRLSAYLDGEVPVETAQEIRTHLSGCSTCAWEAEKLRRLEAVLSDEQPVAADPYFAVRLRAALDRHRPPIAARAWWRGALIPVTVALGLFVGAQVGIHLNRGWLEWQYAEVEKEALADSQTITENYIEMNGWPEVDDEE